jgi:hypothetical protein
MYVLPVSDWMLTSFWWNDCIFHRAQWVEHPCLPHRLAASSVRMSTVLDRWLKFPDLRQVAGITALVMSVRGKDLQALKLKKILSTTAQQVPADSGPNDIQSVLGSLPVLFKYVFPILTFVLWCSCYPRWWWAHRRLLCNLLQNHLIGRCSSAAWYPLLQISTEFYYYQRGRPKLFVQNWTFSCNYRQHLPARIPESFQYDPSTAWFINCAGTSQSSNIYFGPQS